MDPNRDMLNDIFKMTKENNQMLHSMRRSALISKILKLIVILAFTGVSWWFYLTFVAPVVMTMLNTMNQIQGTGAQAQVQISQFQDMLKGWQDKLPAFMHSATSTKNRDKKAKLV